MNVSNGEQFLELCKTVVAAAGEGEAMQSTAEALLVAFIFNTMDHETMQACHRIAGINVGEANRNAAHAADFDRATNPPSGAGPGPIMTITPTIAPNHLTSEVVSMRERRPCECPYYDDRDGFIGWNIAPTEAEIKTASYGWLCAECYDQLEVAWEHVLERQDELVVLDRDGDRVA